MKQRVPMERFFFFSIFLLLPPLFFIINITFAFPLSTDSRWIVDDGNKGRRVKLTCVNWPSHLETAVAEGLSKQPLDSIGTKIVSMGFNCVRLTWPLYLATDESFSGITTVRQSLRKLGLLEALSGFQANNPYILDLPLIKAFQVINHFSLKVLSLYFRIFQGGLVDFLTFLIQELYGG